MNNSSLIYTDGINAYATFQVNANKKGKLILGICLIILIVFVIALFSTVESEEIGGMLIPGLIITIFLIGLPSKYLLWNIYGKEELIVSSKSISWSYDYGILKTNLKTLKFNRLGIGFEKVNSINDKELGKLLLFNYNEENNLPELIHETTVLISLDELKKFESKINEVFAGELQDENGFIPYSLN